MFKPSNPNLEYLAGKNIKSFRPFAPFDSILCDFLQDTSSELINRPESKKYPDIMAFAFLALLVGAVFFTAYLGGTLVWTHGVGTP